MTLLAPRPGIPALATLAAGALLLLSPLLFGFGGWAALSAYLLGAAAVAFKVKPLLRPAPWDRWALAGAGLLACAMPWLAGFADQPGATWTHLLLGLAVGLGAMLFPLQPARPAADAPVPPQGPAETP